MTASAEARETALLAAQAAADKLATDVSIVDVVVHVQHAEERAYYALERLWKDCPTIPFTDSAAASAAPTEAAPSGEETAGP